MGTQTHGLDWGLREEVESVQGSPCPPPDPYVKASLISEGRRLKKRKTSIKKNTLNPTYNEALVFDVAPESVESVGLSIAVVDYDW